MGAGNEILLLAINIKRRKGHKKWSGRRSLFASMAEHVTDHPTGICVCTQDSKLARLSLYIWTHWSSICFHFVLLSSSFSFHQFRRVFPFSQVITRFIIFEGHMSRVVLVLLALCVLPALVSAKIVGKPFHVQGRVYCDTCRCGFETSATTYIAGMCTFPSIYVLHCS